MNANDVFSVIFKKKTFITKIFFACAFKRWHLFIHRLQKNRRLKGTKKIFILIEKINHKSLQLYIKGHS